MTAELIAEAPSRLAQTVEDLRRTYAAGTTKSAQWRIDQLAAIERLLAEREGEIADALAADLGRSPEQAWLADIASTQAEAAYARKHLEKWMRKTRVALPWNQLPATGWIQYEPLGLVLVIGPWNYPLYLTLGPLVASIAAGNCTVIKPSEFAPHMSALLTNLIPQYLDPAAVVVIEGDGGVTQELLAQGFDHAFFTGGGEIGKKIMAGAAAQLTPVTLELGGKSPVIVTADADLNVTARRIAMFKLLNSGQTCIAPDYVLVDRAVRDELVAKIAAAVVKFQDGSTTVRIVNERQFDRLAGYLSTTAGKLALGGGSDKATLTMEPTIVLDPSADEPVMTDEIFGPILPVITYDSIDDAIARVNSGPKPLASYIFTKSKVTRNRLIDEIPSGASVVNHIAFHALVPQLPFGGVGGSGMGSYHGKWGFETLSHRKAVLAKTFTPDLRFVYPPYSKLSMKVLRRLF